MPTIKNLILISLLTGLYSAAIGQSTSPTITSLIPVSPNAASLGKYGEIPVGLYTGIPTISVPIYEVNTGSLKLPITLNYHAGGIRVEEMASWVGLGWSLNAGGVISRQVRDMPDEFVGGYLSTYRDIYKFIAGMSPLDQQTYFNNISTYAEDCQPDLFSFNFGGESGQFFFDTTGAVIQMPKTRNKFEFGNFLGTNNWKVTDINGNQYFFTDQEITDAEPVSDGALPQTALPNAVTSWYLTEMVNALGTDTIEFQYNISLTSFNTITSQTKYISNSASSTCTKQQDDNTSNNTITGYRLSKIIFKNGSVTFNASGQDRCDFPGDYALSSISINDNNSHLNQTFQLYQSYVTTNGSPCDQNHPENTRLFLDSILISTGQQPIERYKFAYNKTITLPSRLSYNQDHWGYYNGANNGTDFIPLTDLETIAGATLLVTGADRGANPSYSQGGILQSITYPTGGSTQFEYENNTIKNPPSSLGLVTGTRSFFINPNNNPGGTGPRLYIDTTFTVSDNFQGLGGVNATITLNNGGGDCATSVSLSCPLVNISGPNNTGGYITSSQPMFLPEGNYEVTVDLTGVTDPSIIQGFYFSIVWNYQTTQPDSVQNDFVVGGVRIKSITNYNADNSIAQVKKYTYVDIDSASAVSSGTLLSYPQYIGTLAVFVSTNNDPLGSIACSFITVSSGSNLPLLETQNSYVGYKYVQEYLGQNGEYGKNIYEYTSPEQIPDRLILNFPYPPATTFDWKRGQLLHQWSYKFNGADQSYSLVQEKVNTYSDADASVVQGLKIGQNDLTIQTPLDGPVYETAQYSTEASWFPLISDTTRLYDQGNPGLFSQVVHNYAYNHSYFLPISDTTTNSKGQIEITNTEYPLDFVGLSTNDPLTAGIAGLQGKNIIAPVIERYTIRQNPDGTNARITQAVITSYKPDRPLRDSVWAIEPAGDGVTGFTPASVNGGAIVKSNMYVPQIVFPKYDHLGNTIEQKKAYDLTTTYLWDYLGEYPVAEVKNADSTDIAYTGFEADGTGNWSISGGSVDNTQSIAGRSSYQNGVITISGLNAATTYIVSYWSQNGAYSIPGTISGYPQQGKTVSYHTPAWTLYVHKVTGQSAITVNATGHIDELRLYPATAQMTTYTYDPLVGMTSHTDPGNRTTYYEYDGLGRLIRIRDQDYNILKTIEYQYQAPAGCGSGCYSIAMQTFAGTNTLSYPVGVFDVNGNLVGNATNAAGYVSLWNSDTADARVGALSQGADSLHFNLAVNAGQTPPAGVMGCRYYQFDLNWNIIDGIRNFNGAYVAFGDGTGMRLGKNNMDTPKVIAPNTTYAVGGYTDRNTNVFRTQVYFIHSYSDTALKTLTFYHNDDSTNSDLDNISSPATSLNRLSNLRGNLPQNTQWIGGSSYQNASAMSLAQVTNWNSISSVFRLNLQTGDGGQTNPNHVGYPQDFMKNNKGLQVININECVDTSFKMSRLKSDWNTYFTQIFWLAINDNEWNRENLSALINLRAFWIISTSTNGAGVIDSIINQIAIGAGHYITNGSIGIGWPGYDRTAASADSYTYLKSRGWTIYINGVYE